MKRSPTYANLFNRFTCLPSLRELYNQEVYLRKEIESLRKEMKLIENSKLIDHEDKKQMLDAIKDNISFHESMIEENIKFVKKHGLLNRHTSHRNPTSSSCPKQPRRGS